MRILLIGLGIVGALCYVGFSFYKNGKRPSYVGLAFILIPTLMLLGAEVRWQSYESTATMIVKDVSKNPKGQAQCQRFSEAFLDAGVATKGEVFYAEPNTAKLKYQTCQDFIAWLNSDKEHPTLEQILAVEVVVHEAEHVSGDFNEASAECKAMKALPDIALKLGATEPQAQLLAKLYREQVHPMLADKYQNGTC